MENGFKSQFQIVLTMLPDTGCLEMVSRLVLEAKYSFVGPISTESNEVVNIVE